MNTNDDEGSETSGSEYDDDDEDVTDEDEEANEAGNVVTADTTTDVTALAGTADDAQPPVDLVESLLSSMVTNAIDGAVELQGGATAIMSCVDVSVEGANELNETVTDVSVAVEDVTEEVSAVNTEAGIESTAGGTDDDAAEAALDAGATAFADELRQHTVVQLKTICQEHQVGVRRADGSSKRKDELVADLVVALYEGGDNDAQDTASNESANAAIKNCGNVRPPQVLPNLVGGLDPFRGCSCCHSGCGGMAGAVLLAPARALRLRSLAGTSQIRR